MPTTNHPNRSRGASPSRNPRPAEIRAWRESEGLSARAAAELVHSTTRAWQQWEAPADQPTLHRRMHPAMWDLARARAAAARGDWDAAYGVLLGVA